MSSTIQGSVQSSQENMPQDNETPPATGAQQGSLVHSKFAEIAWTSLATVFAGLIGANWFGEWVVKKENPPNSSQPIAIHRAIIYAKILAFRDREQGEKPLYTKKVRLAGNAIEQEITLYDEALYLETFYLQGSHANRVSLEGHSSGIVDVTPIVPQAAEFDLHHYEQSAFKHLSYTLDISKRDYLTVAYHYYNGFQFNPSGRKYESDGGVHFEYPVDEAVVIFDFSNVATQKRETPFRIRGTPVVSLKRSKDGPKEPVEFSYQDGILTTKSISNIQKGTHIFCDWEWETELRESEGNS